MLVAVAATAAAWPDECNCGEVLMTMWIVQAGGFVAVAFTIGMIYLIVKKQVGGGR